MFFTNRTLNDHPYTIMVDDIEVEVTRKRVKNLNIRIVEPNGEVRVSAPFIVGENSIADFVRERKDWIRSSQRKVKERARNLENMSALARQKQFLDGETLYVWGKPYQIITNTAGRWGLSLEDDFAKFQVTKNSTAESRQNYLKKWYSEETERVGRHYIQKWETETGLRSSEIKARFMKSRWGTCNTKTGKITLNSQLAVFDQKFIDYVVLHEITHLKVPNHGKDFYAFMDKHMKNWKTIRKQLNNFSI